MKEYFIDEHNKSCIDNDKFKEYHSCYPERFLFFLGNDFYLIAFNSCLEHWRDRYDFKVDLIKSFCENNKPKTLELDRYLIQKSWNVETYLKDFRIRNRNLKTHVCQVNYLYRDNAMKEYAIVTKTKFIDAICDSKIVNDNYQKAELFLKEKGYTWLLDELKSLWLQNTYYIGDAEVFKSIAHCIKEIRRISKKMKEEKVIHPLKENYEELLSLNVKSKKIAKL
jgi:hypothetical protein